MTIVCPAASHPLILLYVLLRKMHVRTHLTVGYCVSEIMRQTQNMEERRFDHPSKRQLLETVTQK